MKILLLLLFLLPLTAKSQVTVPQDTLYLNDEFVNDTLYKHPIGYIGKIVVGTTGYYVMVENTLPYITRTLLNHRYIYRTSTGAIINARYYINKYGYQIPL